MRFWDASAVVALCIEEPRTPHVRALEQDNHDLLVWWGTPVECASAVARRLREGELRAGEEVRARVCFTHLFERVNEVAATEAVRDRAERLLAVHPLRAADALQLAAALVWARERTAGLGFVCLDDRLRATAGREGFSVLPLAGEPATGAR